MVGALYVVISLSILRLYRHEIIQIGPVPLFQLFELHLTGLGWTLTGWWIVTFFGIVFIIGFLYCIGGYVLWNRGSQLTNR